MVVLPMEVTLLFYILTVPCNQWSWNMPRSRSWSARLCATLIWTLSLAKTPLFFMVVVLISFCMSLVWYDAMFRAGKTCYIWDALDKDSSLNYADILTLLRSNQKTNGENIREVTTRSTLVPFRQWTLLNLSVCMPLCRIPLSAQATTG